MKRIPKIVPTPGARRTPGTPTLAKPTDHITQPKLRTGKGSGDPLTPIGPRFGVKRGPKP